MIWRTSVAASVTDGLYTPNLNVYSSGAHGLYALIETTVNEETHTLLFDTGPDSKSIIRNVHALKAEEKIKTLERIVLSHWHKDHSGGLLSLLELRNTLSPDAPVTVDLHPDRPIARGRPVLLCDRTFD